MYLISYPPPPFFLVDFLPALSLSSFFVLPLFSWFFGFIQTMAYPNNTYNERRKWFPQRTVLNLEEINNLRYRESNKIAAEF